MVDVDKFDRVTAFTREPSLLFPFWLRPCTVKILIVTDSAGSFNLADFGLAELLTVLAVPPGPYVTFQITKAHRGAFAQGANITNFRFDKHDLSQYDEMWLFAVARGAGAIGDAEVAAIATFMDGGGGVFATGDHEDLGVDMCGRIPRVRSMRRWWWPSPGPNGEPVAPPVGGFTRHDTTLQGAFAPTEFEDQSDDVPQVIQPKMYSAWGGFLHNVVYPHPLLCGPKGVLRYLPDHPHEGVCEVPSDLTATLTFGGSSFTEYPTRPDGSVVEPEVIATGHNGPGIVSKGGVNSKTFGVIGAYDGHQASVGRVVVDSTWHHFFNINLIGDPIAGEPAQRVGFGASATGIAKYEDIKAYFRNIAVWLARPQRQWCMRWRVIWDSRWYSQLVMDVRVYKEMREIPLVELIRIGTVARDVLGRLASRCQSLEWIFGVLDELLPIELIRPVRPWPPLPDPPPDFDVVTNVYSQVILDAAIGGMIYAIAERYPDPSADITGELERLEEEDRELIERGVRIATDKVFEAMRESSGELERLMGLGRSGSGQSAS